MVERVSSPIHGRTGWVRKLRAVLGATLIAAIVAGGIGHAPTAAVLVPKPKPLPETVDLAQQYQGQSLCTPPPKPGIAKLQQLLRRTYGAHPIYTSRSCASDPTSEHTEGRALDWMVSMRRPSERAKAQAFLEWLLAPGEDGTPAEMARRMGVMYIGWNSRIWRAYRGPGWGELKGCLSKPATSWDTYCHRDHIHFSLTWDGAAGQTSYWDGSAQVVPACPSREADGPAPKAVAATRWITLATPRLVIDTASGFGNRAQPCRLQESRWSGDTQRMSFQLTGGKGRLPANTQRVAIRLTTRQANAPAGIYVWPTGRSQGPIAFHTLMNANKSVSMRRNLGANGSLSIATGTGDVAYRVEILRYEVPR